MQRFVAEAPRARPRLKVSLARSLDDVRAVQRLRWEVFALEQGAKLISALPGHDVDRFDDYCEHLMVHDAVTGRVVGTYRLLTADGARRAGGYYAESEFDCRSLVRCDAPPLEIGRSCVHRDYRNGATIALLWSGIADVLSASEHPAIIGCASISLSRNRNAGVRLAHHLASVHRAPVQHSVRPKRPLQAAVDCAGDDASVPPLIKAYLRCGAVVCGAPAYDPDFDCADLLVRLEMRALAGRYARHFLGTSPDAHA